MGRTGTAGKITYRKGFDSRDAGDNDRQAFVSTLSIGPIDAIEGQTVDRAPVTYSSTGAAIGAFAGFMWSITQLGAVPEAHALSFGEGFGTPPGWTEQHKLSGKAAATWGLRFDTKGKQFQAGVPAPMWTVRGAKCYDPTKDSTYPGGSGSHRLADPADTAAYDAASDTWEYTEEPYLLGLHWAHGYWQRDRNQTGSTYQRVMGIGAPKAMIDIAAFVEGRNVAIANGWKCGGVVYSTDGKYDTLKRILQAGMGEPVALGARISCLVNAPKVSLATITRDDLRGTVSVAATQPRRNRINTITPRYRLEANNWQTLPGPPISVPEYVAMDRGKRSKLVDYHLIQDTDQVATAVRYDIENAREFGPITLPLRLLWMGYKPGDCVTVDIPEQGVGLNGQPVLLLNREIGTATGIVTMTARSETAAKHAYALGQTTTPPTTPGLSASPIIPTPGTDDWSVTALTPSADVVSPTLIVTGAAKPNVDSILFEYRVFDEEDVWSVSGSDAATAVRREITGLKAGTAYEVAVSYFVRGIVGDRRIYGPVTTAGDKAGDAIADEADPDILTSSKKVDLLARDRAIQARYDELYARYAALRTRSAAMVAAYTATHDAMVARDLYLASLDPPLTDLAHNTTIMRDELDAVFDTIATTTESFEKLLTVGAPAGTDVAGKPAEDVVADQAAYEARLAQIAADQAAYDAAQAADAIDPLMEDGSLTYREQQRIGVLFSEWGARVEQLIAKADRYGVPRIALSTAYYAAYNFLLAIPGFGQPNNPTQTVNYGQWLPLFNNLTDAEDALRRVLDAAPGATAGPNVAGAVDQSGTTGPVNGFYGFTGTNAFLYIRGANGSAIPWDGSPYLSITVTTRNDTGVGSAFVRVLCDTDTGSQAFEVDARKGGGVIEFPPRTRSYVVAQGVNFTAGAIEMTKAVAVPVQFSAVDPAKIVDNVSDAGMTYGVPGIVTHSPTDINQPGLDEDSGGFAYYPGDNAGGYTVSLAGWRYLVIDARGASARRIASYLDVPLPGGGTAKYPVPGPASGSITGSLSVRIELSKNGSVTLSREFNLYGGRSQGLSETIALRDAAGVPLYDTLLASLIDTLAAGPGDFVGGTREMLTLRNRNSLAELDPGAAGAVAGATVNAPMLDVPNPKTPVDYVAIGHTMNETWRAGVLTLYDLDFNTEVALETTVQNAQTVLQTATVGPVTWTRYGNVYGNGGYAWDLWAKSYSQAAKPVVDAGDIKLDASRPATLALVETSKGKSAQTDLLVGAQRGAYSNSLAELNAAEGAKFATVATGAGTTISFYDHQAVWQKVGNSFTRSAANGSAWNLVNLYSTNAIGGGATVSCEMSGNSIFGLSMDQGIDSYPALDFAIFTVDTPEALVNGYSVQVTESGTTRAAFPLPSTGVFSVSYDRSTVKYARNGEVFYTSPTPIDPNWRMYAGFNIYSIGGGIRNIQFLPYKDTTFGAIGGLGQQRIEYDTKLGKSAQTDVLVGAGSLAYKSNVSFATEIAYLPLAIQPSSFFASGYLKASTIYHTAGAKNLDTFFPEEVGSNRTQNNKSASTDILVGAQRGAYSNSLVDLDASRAGSLDAGLDANGRLKSGLLPAGAAAPTDVADLIGNIVGTQLCSDPEFRRANTVGTVFQVYDNAGSGKTTIALAAGAVPNGSGRYLQISYDGTGQEGSYPLGPTPGYGGYVSLLYDGGPDASSRPQVYRRGSLIYFCLTALIPVGRVLNFHSNPYGDGLAVWMTSQAGTGTWKRYVLRLQIGSSGAFGVTGFFAVHGGANVPFSWAVCRHDIIEWQGSNTYAGESLRDEDGASLPGAAIRTSVGKSAQTDLLVGAQRGAYSNSLTELNAAEGVKLQSTAPGATAALALYQTFSATGLNVTIEGNKVTGPGAGDWYYFVRSRSYIRGACEVRARMSGDAMFGLTTAQAGSQATAQYAGLKYAIYQHVGGLQVYEQGAYQAGWSFGQAIGDVVLTAGMECEVRDSGSQIEFYAGGKLLYTSIQPYTKDEVRFAAVTPTAISVVSEISFLPYSDVTADNQVFVPYYEPTIITASPSGVIDAGQLPFARQFSFYVGEADVSPYVSWTVETQIGATAAINNDSGSLLRGRVSVATLTAAVGVIGIAATYRGRTIRRTLLVLKTLREASAADFDTLTVQVPGYAGFPSDFSFTGADNYFFNPGSADNIFYAGTDGKLRFIAEIAFTSSSTNTGGQGIAASTNIAAKFQYALAGSVTNPANGAGQLTWIDVGPETVSQIAAGNTPSLPGSLSISVEQTGLTPNVKVFGRMLVREVAPPGGLGRAPVTTQRPNDGGPNYANMRRLKV